MKISHEMLHDSLVATYQSVEAAMLNKVLKENGIKSKKARHKIISEFLFDQGVTLDQMWFKEKRRKYYPGVYFSTRPHDLLERATVYLPCREVGMNFHEYAHGATEWALKNENGGDQIETGND